MHALSQGESTTSALSEQLSSALADKSDLTRQLVACQQLLETLRRQLEETQTAATLEQARLTQVVRASVFVPSIPRT